MKMRLNDLKGMLRAWKHRSEHKLPLTLDDNAYSRFEWPAFHH